MAEKTAPKKATTGKAVATKKPVAAAKKPVAATKKTATQEKMSKGDMYECEVCGLSVVIDEACGCADVHEIICCSRPMQEKKVKVKARAAK